MNENENLREKQEYQEVVIEVIPFPYVDIISISGGSDARLPYR